MQKGCLGNSSFPFSLHFASSLFIFLFLSQVWMVNLITKSLSTSAGVFKCKCRNCKGHSGEIEPGRREILAYNQMNGNLVKERNRKDIHLKVDIHIIIDVTLEHPDIHSQVTVVVKYNHIFLASLHLSSSFSVQIFIPVKLSECNEVVTSETTSERKGKFSFTKQLTLHVVSVSLCLCCLCMYMCLCMCVECQLWHSVVDPTSGDLNNTH